MECKFRLDYPNTESSESEQMDSSDNCEEYEETSDSSSEESSNESEQSSESEMDDESNEDENEGQANDKQQSMEESDELYVQAVSLVINDIEYAKDGFCGRLMVPIKSIEAAISLPDGPDEDGEYEYKILLKSGKELTTFCKCPPVAFRTYLFDVSTYYDRYAERYGTDPYM